MRLFRRLLAGAVLLAPAGPAAPLAAPLAAQQAAPAAPAAAPTAAPKPIDPANVDTTCAACADFFRYANGGWLKRTEIPGDQARWGSFNELQERNQLALRGVLTDAAAGRLADRNGRLLGAFYASCMDSAAVERAGLAPIAAELDAVAKLQDRAKLAALIGRLHREGTQGAFGFSSGQDARRSERVIAILSQGGLGMPDRDYYTRTDSAAQVLRGEYAAHVARLLLLAGDDSAAAARSAGAILAFETALAQASMTRLQRRNPDSTYHLMPTAELQRRAPRFAWREYLAAIGAPAVAEVNVNQPGFVAAFDSLAAAAPMETWRAYLRWHLLRGAAPTLGAAFVNESFRFNGAVLQGTKSMQPRWKRCLQATDAGLGEALGQEYVKTRFTPEAKARALAMVRNIQAEFRSRLGELAWMTPATKQKAFAKLDAMVNKIGYPERWRSYEGLSLAKGAPYGAQARRVARFNAAYQLGKIGRPVNRAEWVMSPPTVNAYYSGTRNEIVFPAGIMQPPFFDPDADDAVNYGGMGAVIGHEITHGFDDQGRKYDAQGNVSGWWAPEDEAAFTERAERVVEQFAGYVAVDTLRLNGRLTLGENLADLGGLTIAYHAWRRSLDGKEPAPIDGFTGDQRFFLAWAQIWRGMARPEWSRMAVVTDTHSPGRWRVNGPLANMPEFAKAFGCTAGDAMVRGEEVRAVVW